MNPIKFKDDISIVISGEAGQGLQSLEQIMSHLAKSSGHNAFTYSEFMSRIRGGNNSTFMRIASKKVSSFVERIDIFISFSKGAMSRFKNRITKDTLIIGDKSFIDEKYSDGHRTIYIPFEDKINYPNGSKFINTFYIGFLSTLLGFTFDDVTKFIEKRFASSKEEIINKNIEAVKEGFEAGNEILAGGKISVEIGKSEPVKEQMILNGSEAVGIGAIAGGCNFISSYPMSPSTGVLTFLAKNAEEFGIIAEQAEDEISAMNMGIGAWYAGARAMVTTSGGGFALMTEALSLAGAVESPMVIHLGQRPGPATGLPTRTEQGDFLMSLYAGHGEFPRVILAPGDAEDGIRLTHHAFNIADEYQAPVIILTDQYFIDSSVNMTDFHISNLKTEKYIEKITSDYARYKLTENGISPRGIPGYGQGIVQADSDEHDEHGRITEDFDVRKSMVDKRLKKLDLLRNGVIPPVHFGSGGYKYAVVSWGSTLHAVKEAISSIERDDIAFFFYSQLYPLHPGTGDLLKKALKTIIIENNATSQFGSFVRQETGIEFDHKILKYNGMPFSVEEIRAEIIKFIS